MNKSHFIVKPVNFCILILILVFSVSAQTKKAVLTKRPVEIKTVVEKPKPAERPVRISLKEGEPISGTFVNSDNEGMQIVVAGNSLTIKWNVISQIIFTDVSQNKVLTKVENKLDKQKESTKDALKSLRKLVAATEVLSWNKRDDFQEFGRRLIDVKAEVNEVLPDIVDEDVKNQINKTMEAYDDALTAWKYMFGDNPSGRTMGDLFPDFEPGKTLQQKYSIPTYSSGSYNLMGGDKVLNTIWQAARTHIESVEKSINK